jgi:uncharacterized protein YcbK (DUF882 family)
MSTFSYAPYPNFKPQELACKHTNQHGVREELVRFLQAMRNEFGRPIVITSGYRHPTHPVEARKAEPGAHSAGLAVDIACRDPRTVHELVRLGFKHGATGIGISQRAGRPQFVHMDLMPRRALWSY